jgi:hypothetical protein
MPEDEDILKELNDIERMGDDELMTIMAGLLIAYGADNGDAELLKRRDAIFAEFDKRFKD